MTIDELKTIRARNEMRMKTVTERAARAAQDLERAIAAFTRQCERVSLWERGGRRALEGVGR